MFSDVIPLDKTSACSNNKKKKFKETNDCIFTLLLCYLALTSILLYNLHWYSTKVSVM